MRSSLVRICLVAGALTLLGAGQAATAQTVQYPINPPATPVTPPAFPVPDPTVVKVEVPVVAAATAAAPAAAPVVTAAPSVAPNAVVVVTPKSEVLGNTVVRDLPFTGSSATQPLVAAGVSMLVAGGAFVLVTRRRQSAVPARRAGS